MIGYFKRILKIIWESAFDEKKKKPGLKFNPGLGPTGIRKSGFRALKSEDRDILRLSCTMSNLNFKQP